MNTRQYYYLSTIANYGNLSHAAQALHVSPSALSKFLAECERTFGFALFLRYNRRLYPTAVGRYVVECAQKILDEQNRMLLTMKEVTGGNRKAIRLATAPNRGAIIFSRIYNQFSRRYPDNEDGTDHSKCTIPARTACHGQRTCINRQSHAS